MRGLPREITAQVVVFGASSAHQVALFSLVSREWNSVIQNFDSIIWQPLCTDLLFSDFQKAHPYRRKAKKKEAKEVPTKTPLARPLSGYLLFANERRQELQALQPEWTPIQVSKELAVAWKALAEEEREPYNHASSVSKEEYRLALAEQAKTQAKLAEDAEMAKWNNDLREQLEQKISITVQLSRTKTWKHFYLANLVHKTIRSWNSRDEQSQVKRPCQGVFPVGFRVYVCERYANLQRFQKRHNLFEKADIGHILWRGWKQMSKEDKEIYSGMELSLAVAETSKSSSKGKKRLHSDFLSDSEVEL